MWELLTESFHFEFNSSGYYSVDAMVIGEVEWTWHGSDFVDCEKI